MTDATPARPRQLVLTLGLALAVGLAAVLALWPQIGPRVQIETADDLAAWVQAHPEGASVWVWDVDTGGEQTNWNGDRVRPVVGLTALLLAAEYARQVENGLDTTYQVPASTLELRRLPAVEADAADVGALALPALVRAAARGNRPAADELLRILGREGVDAIPRQLELTDVEPPMPIAGLLLAWAPEQWVDGTTPTEQAERFVRLARSAQRDSAYARERAYQTSTAYRAEETARLQRNGLGLPEAEIQATAAVTFPRGTAHAYADLLTRAVDSSLISSDRSAQVLRSLRSAQSDSVRVTSGALVGLVGAAVLVQVRERHVGAVILVEGLPVAPDVQAIHAQAAVELAERWARNPALVRSLAE